MAANKKKARRKRRKRQAEHREWRIDCSAAISLQIPLMLETLAKLVRTSCALTMSCATSSRRHWSTRR